MNRRTVLVADVGLLEIALPTMIHILPLKFKRHMCKTVVFESNSNSSGIFLITLILQHDLPGRAIIAFCCFEFDIVVGAYVDSVLQATGCGSNDHVAHESELHSRVEISIKGITPTLLDVNLVA
jgi:hypothetical protein